MIINMEKTDRDQNPGKCSSLTVQSEFSCVCLGRNSSFLLPQVRPGVTSRCTCVGLKYTHDQRSNGCNETTKWWISRVIYHIPFLSESESHQSDPHIRRRVLQTGPGLEFYRRQSMTVSHAASVCQTGQEAPDGDGEKRRWWREEARRGPLSPHLESRLAGEEEEKDRKWKERRGTDSAYGGETAWGSYWNLKMLESKRSFEPQEKEKSCDGGWSTEGLGSR